MHCGISDMGRRAVHIKFCRAGFLSAFKGDLPCASSDVHSVPRLYFIDPSVHRDDPVSADVDQAQLPSLKKIFCPELFSRRQAELLLNRYGRSRDDPVNMAVHQTNLIRLKQSLNQKFLSQPVCRIMSDILR